MSSLGKAQVTAISKSTVTSLSGKITTALTKSGAAPGAAVHALSLQPVPAPLSTSQRRRLLWELVTSDPNATARVTRLASVDSTLRLELPGRLAKTPLTPATFGLKTPDEVVDVISRRLAHMQTGAKSRAEFEAGLDGWRRNVAGSVLFERIVKHEPQLGTFFHSLGQDFLKLFNEDIAIKSRKLPGVDGKLRTVTAQFSAPEKVLELTLLGSDDVPRQFTDFGQLATNAQGLWAFLPIELKLERALAGVSGQFSEFRPRLAEAKSMTATVLVGGQQMKRIIRPEQLVFLRHDMAQTAVAPTSRKRLDEMKKTNQITPGSVASITDFGLAFSSKFRSWHYRVRILVDRRWLEEILRPLTDR